MPDCDYCGTELKEVLRYEDSTYYICGRCRVLWDFVDNNTLNGDDSMTVDVRHWMNGLKIRKMAS